jgi:hypothetical protein
LRRKRPARHPVRFGQLLTPNNQDLSDGRQTMTEDATKVAPHVYKVVFENERARVLEVRMKLGESTTRHSHRTTSSTSLAAAR